LQGLQQFLILPDIVPHLDAADAQLQLSDCRFGLKTASDKNLMNQSRRCRSRNGESNKVIVGNGLKGEPALADFWVGTSWKMNKTLDEALSFASALAEFLPELDPRIQAFVIPPFTAARQVKAALAQTRAKVGAQNMHWADSGAWTGEISPVMLRDCRLDLVELGHSERREHFGETDRTVGLKTAAAVSHGLVPLICVGETLADRNEGRSEEVLTAQVEGALQYLDGDAALSARILFAYEPVWAIGENGIPASADYADRQQALIKQVAADRLASPPPTLYGGSVNAENAAGLVAQPNIDGLFVGRAAWQAEGYIRMLGIVSAAL
jgi:L-erythrulose 1-phosphate isomerase